MKFKTFNRLAWTLGSVGFTAAVVGSCVLWIGCPGKSAPKPDPAASTVTATSAPPPVTAATALAPRATAPTSAGVGQCEPLGAGPLRPLDQEILRRASAGITGDKVKDAFPGAKCKVSLFKDAGKSRVNRAKVDLDRDEKWDEKWTFEEEGGQEKVKRQVAPNDDEAYTDDYRLREGAWVKK